MKSFKSHEKLSFVEVLLKSIVITYWNEVSSKSFVEFNVFLNSIFETCELNYK